MEKWEVDDYKKIKKSIKEKVDEKIGQEKIGIKIAFFAIGIMFIVLILTLILIFGDFTITSP